MPKDRSAELLRDALRGSGLSGLTSAAEQLKTARELLVLVGDHPYARLTPHEAGWSVAFLHGSLPSELGYEDTWHGPTLTVHGLPLDPMRRSGEYTVYDLYISLKG